MLRIDQYLIRKRIRLCRCDPGHKMHISIRNGDNLHSSILQLLLHLLSITISLRFTSRRGQCNVQYPILPNCVLFCFGAEPAFTAFSLEKLEDYLAAGCFGLVLR